MSGQFDSPEERRARDEAAGREPPAELVASAGTAVEVIESDQLRTNPYGRQWNGPRTAPALIASAARLNISDRRAVEDMRRRRQGWQTEAWDYFDEVGEIGYCADEQTEILTDNGWVTHDRLAEGDRVWTLNHDTGLAEWNTVEAVHRFASHGREMVGYDTQAHSSLTTPAHRWPVMDWKSRTNTYGRRWTTSAALTNSDRIVTAAPRADQPEPKYSDAFVELVGWFWTEGTIRRNPGQTSERVGISQSPKVNPAHVERIRAALTAVYGPAAGTMRTGARRGPAAWMEYHYVHRPLVEFRLNHEASAPLLAAAPDRNLSTHFLSALSPAQARLLVDTSVDGDGWRRGQTAYVGQQNEQRIRAFEPAVILAGLTPRTFHNPVTGQWITSISRSAWATVRTVRLRREQYDGTVWCPSTANQTWMARREGTVYFTGNTTSFIANLMSKIRLYPAIHSHEGPIAVEAVHDEGEAKEDTRRDLADAGVTPAIADLAIATLQRLRSVQGGQSALIRELSLNLEVAGECYIHGHQETEGDPDPGDDDDYDPDDTYDPSLIEDWNIRSVDELVPVGDEFQLRRGPGIKLGARLPDGDLVIRIWERHPRFSEMATCAMRRVLSEAESLLLLSREVRATAKSRLSNGILLIPSELSFGPVDPTTDEGDGEETTDPFDDELQQAMITPIQEEGSASAVVPLVLRGPADLLQHVNHLALDKNLDPVLDARIEQRILRIARGLNMPTEVTTGLMATTFANAVQVKRSEFEDHIEPRAVLVCDAITSGYFQWALEQAGVAPEIARQIFCWFDASQLIQVEDMSEQATKAHEDGIISDAARRRYTGFTEEDAPVDEEILRRLLLRGGRMDPFIEANLFRLTGLVAEMPIPAPPSGVLGVTESVSAMPIPGAPAPGTEQPPTGGTGAPPSEVQGAGHPTGSGTWGKLGGQLVGIDRELRTRIIGKLDQAMRAVMEKAGNRLKAKVQRDKGGEYSALRQIADGVPTTHVAQALGKGGVVASGMNERELVDGGFDQALEDVRAWMGVAYERAVRAVERAAGPTNRTLKIHLDANHARNVDGAITWLRDNLTALAQERLYAPTATQAPEGEHDGTVLIPANLVRAAVAVAGGAAPRGGGIVTEPSGVKASAWLQLGGAGPVTNADGSPLGGIATGNDLMTAVGSIGASAEGWQWEYGAGMRSEFQPHLDLDGSIVARTDDPYWANSGTFPPTDFYFPGDHDGCVCDIIPIIVGPGGMQTESVEDLNAMEAGTAAQEAEEVAPATEAADVAADEAGISTLSPNDLADALGYTEGNGDVTAEDLAAAKASLREARQDIQDAAGQVAAEHEDLLRAGDIDATRGHMPYIYSAGERTKMGDTGTGEYDWFDGLSDKEKSRLRAWMENRAEQTTTRASIDEIAQALAPRFGLESDADTSIVMGRWLQETRIIDAANALANNRAINAARYGGLDINSLIESPYDLRVLFGGNEGAIAELARANTSEAYDEAAQLLGSPYGRIGASPWEMTEAEYIAEAQQVEAALNTISPEEEWSSESERITRRYAELAPLGMDNPDLSWSELYREILRTARYGGLI